MRLEEASTPAAGAASGPGALRIVLPGIASLAALAALCCAPLALPGWFSTHEEIRPIGRALAAYHEIAGGDLYPRWITGGYLGKGMPLFNFYPPAYSLLVAYGHALGLPLVLSAKLVIYLLFLAGAVGTWLWVRPHLGHWPALLAAVLYLYAPYHLVDLYVRGALAEFTALAAVPFLFHGIDLLLDRRTAGRLAALASASAAVVVSHFLGAVMIAPFAAAYAALRAVRGGGWPALLRVLAGTGLGAALSAFYWLPALAERSALSAERNQQVVSGYYSPFLHFVSPGQWLDPTWGFGGSGPGAEDGMSFQLGLVVLAAVALSAATLPFLAGAARRFVLLALGLAAAAVWLTSAAAEPLYRLLGPLQIVQFPWRFLGPASLFLAAAGAGVVRVLSERRAWLAPSAVAAAAALAVLLSAPQRTIKEPMPVRDDRDVEALLAMDPWMAKFGNMDEYLPKDADLERASAEPGGPFPYGFGVDVGAVEVGTGEVRFEVDGRAAGGVVVVPWHAFPGWEVTLDGGRWQLREGPHGLLAFPVPGGRHVAHVKFGTTPPRVAGWALAAAALAFLGIAALRERRNPSTVHAPPRPAAPSSSPGAP